MRPENTFTIQDLKNISVIVGKRTTGKTTLLEQVEHPNRILLNHTSMIPKLDELLKFDCILIDDLFNFRNKELKKLILSYSEAKHFRNFNLIISCQSLTHVPTSIREIIDFYLFTSENREFDVINDTGNYYLLNVQKQEFFTMKKQQD